MGHRCPRERESHRRGRLKSSVHRAIMLSPTYRSVGIGRQCGRYRGYTDACFWTADFVIRW